MISYRNLVYVFLTRRFTSAYSSSTIRIASCELDATSRSHESRKK
jgi:hypothetical protein